MIFDRSVKYSLTVTRVFLSPQNRDALRVAHNHPVNKAVKAALKPEEENRGRADKTPARRWSPVRRQGQPDGEGRTRTA